VVKAVSYVSLFHFFLMKQKVMLEFWIGDVKFSGGLDVGSVSFSDALPVTRCQGAPGFKIAVLQMRFPGFLTREPFRVRSIVLCFISLLCVSAFLLLVL